MDKSKYRRFNFEILLKRDPLGTGKFHWDDENNTTK